MRRWEQSVEPYDQLRFRLTSFEIRFFAEDFEATAVTAFDMMPTGPPPAAGHTITSVSVDIDRPFGFLAVQRPSR